MDRRCLDTASDPHGGKGCNAGGQGSGCRFCGFGDFPSCPTGDTPCGGCHDTEYCTADGTCEPCWRRGRRIAEVEACKKFCLSAGGGMTYMYECDFCERTHCPHGCHRGRCKTGTCPIPGGCPTEHYCQGGKCHKCTHADRHKSGCILCSQRPGECVRRFAPYIRFHPGERFYPDDVTNYLKHIYIGSVTKEERRTSQNCGGLYGCNSPSSITYLVPKTYQWDVTLRQLRDIPSGQYMIPRHEVEASSGADAGRYPSFLRGRKNGAPVYVQWKVRGNEVEYKYNIFHPMNVGKSSGIGYYYGNHFGDWEDVSVLVEDNLISRVYSHAHGSEFRYDWQWSSMPQKNGRPVLYSAKNSHGLHPKTGTHPYKVVLKDDTAGGGHEWDTRDNVRLVSWSYRGRWGGPELFKGGTGALREAPKNILFPDNGVSITTGPTDVGEHFHYL